MFRNAWIQWYSRFDTNNEEFLLFNVAFKWHLNRDSRIMQYGATTG
jgi:hypothetical protein